MEQIFTVAGNTFRLTAPDGLAAWGRAAERFRPFAGAQGGAPVLEIDVRAGRLPRDEGAEMIYEPVGDGVGVIRACARRGADGAPIMEFRHEGEAAPRLWMRMTPGLDRAAIVIDGGGARGGELFLSHAIMIAYMLATARTGTLLVHASMVELDGRAYLFQGRSGTGKSTHSGLWIKNIAGAELMNDDHPVVRFTPGGEAVAYGSPWSGKTPCYRNVSAPVGAFVRIVRGRQNELRRLEGLRAYASLTASVFFLPFMADGLRATRHAAIERLAQTTGCFEMHCRPDADAALTCMRGLTEEPKNKN